MEVFVTLGAVAVGAGVWLWLLRRYDRIEPEAVRYLLQVAIVGGFASVLAAATLNEGAGRLLGMGWAILEDDPAQDIGRLLLFCLFVGLNEEVCKAITTVYIVRWLGDFDEPVDAMIYAMTVALGFASIENLIYAARFGNEVLLVRFLWPVPAHMAYAALWGYGLAKARFVYPDRNQLAVMWPSILVAGLVHAAANFLLFLQSTTTALLSLAALGGLAYLAHLRLNRLVAESPFLEPGECPECRNLNSPLAERCVHCDAPLQDTEMFKTCPCGLARVAIRFDQCPKCGVPMEAEKKTDRKPE
jgi:protease PrsW